jgi:hypothetical protein
VTQYDNDATTRTNVGTAPRPAAAPGAHPARWAGSAGDGDGNRFPEPDAAARRRATGRTGAVALLIASLVASAGLRHLAVGIQRGEAAPARRSAASGASLAGMDTYAIALLLGGLRGPLVMVLWANSEAQKTSRDLEGVDTQIEWIRLLQPEFDAVHRFQMWNKAYNLSVQMVGLGNKYTTILDALDYGRNVDAERSDNIDIIKQIGMIYSAKLGDSHPERYYYRERLRKETRHRDPAAGAAIRKDQTGFQRLAHDPLLDEAGNVLPQYTQPSRQRPADWPAGKDFYDGSDLQYLPALQPYPYGVSPFALGYNYHKRSQVLMRETGEVPTQESASVVDAQPAVTLKAWAEEEWERGRRLEAKAFGATLPPERFEQELVTAGLPLGGDGAGVKDAEALAEALYAYDTIDRLVVASRAEYERHLADPEYITKRTLYAPHLDILTALRSYATADAAYLRAMAAAPGSPERAELIRTAADGYRNAIRDWGLLTLRYYTDMNVAEAVLPPGVTRANIGTGGLGSATAVTEQDVMRLLSATRLEIQRRGGTDENAGDRTEYDTYIRRCLERLQHLEPNGPGGEQAQ